MERITTAEAARRLGVSQTQVRRLVAAGKLIAESEERPHGRRIVVLWDATQDEPTTIHVATHVATPDATLLARVQDEVRWLRDRLERAEEERAELRRMLNLEQQTVASLRLQLAPARNGHAPHDATETPPATPPDTPAAHVPRTPRRAPWWRRVFGR